MRLLPRGWRVTHHPILSSAACAGTTFRDRTTIVLAYVTKCLYFLASGLQIRYGYPLYNHGDFLTREYTTLRKARELCGAPFMEGLLGCVECFARVCTWFVFAFWSVIYPAPPPPPGCRFCTSSTARFRSCGSCACCSTGFALTRCAGVNVRSCVCLCMPPLLLLLLLSLNWTSPATDPIPPPSLFPYTHCFGECRRFHSTSGCGWRICTASFSRSSARWWRQRYGDRKKGCAHRVSLRFPVCGCLDWREGWDCVALLS